MKIHRLATCASHMAVLAASVQASDGRVLELGAGVYSTPLLHWLCGLGDRRLVTLESNAEWAGFMAVYRSVWHELHYVPQPAKDDRLSETWGLAFVDNARFDRAPCLERLHHVPLVLVHDTSDAWLDHYKIRGLLDSYRFRLQCDVKPFGNETTLLSDTVDVKALMGRLLA